MEESQLHIVDLKSKDMLRKIENGIVYGLPVLLQDVLEELDPALEPVLAKAFGAAPLLIGAGAVAHTFALAGLRGRGIEARTTNELICNVGVFLGHGVPRGMMLG